jgi:hypothetical protein
VEYLAMLGVDCTDFNITADPDKSNPTRSRWERPLDTIRSFEAAIDGGYSRKSIYRAGRLFVVLVQESLVIADWLQKPIRKLDGTGGVLSIPVSTVSWQH